jgi:hypothetical protein
MRMRISKGIAIGVSAFALTLGMSGATAAVVSAASPRTQSVSSITFSGTASAPTLTINGSGLGTTPTGGVKVARLADCPNATWTGDDYPSGQLWLVDASGAEWDAGNLGSKRSGSCVGWKIVSWSNTKAVLQFGTSYGSSGWILHDNDSLVLSIKRQPAWVSVPSGF